MEDLDFSGLLACYSDQGRTGYNPIMLYAVVTYANMRGVRAEGLITLKQLYIGGTKIEANANRYTFVWRGTLNYHLAGLLYTIDTLYKKYNTLLFEHGYRAKYDLGNAQMFIIEGMDRARSVIEKTGSAS